MQISFIIPLAAKPKQCYNKITPNDLHSDATCAVTGAFLLAGGWWSVMWVCLRALTLHLQICWQVITGKKFFYFAQAAGWGLPAVLVAVALAITGVSYRFGDTCHINYANALEIFWGPMLASAGAAIIVQFATFVYCVKVYLQSLMENSPTSEGASALPSLNGSTRTVSARQTYRRVRRVIELQWRGIAVVLIILADVTFLSVLFVYLDNTTQLTEENLKKAQPWLKCLVLNGGKKDQCLHLTKQMVVGEPTVMTLLILLSTNGIWCLLLLGRWAMVTGWIQLIKTRIERRREFASVDARRFSADPSAYEMLKASPISNDTEKESIQFSPSLLKSPEPAVTAIFHSSPTSVDSLGMFVHDFGHEPGSQTPAQTQRGLTRLSTGEARSPPPPRSFSNPRAPTVGRSPPSMAPRRTSDGPGLGWDATTTYASTGGAIPASERLQNAL
ncbi:MAG: hypothetical protein M1817_004903 [Caeruleum heppii]|nr:MAG: hypothetical protein M1817_004903 [Caeruleum heppii]